VTAGSIPGVALARHKKVVKTALIRKIGRLDAAMDQTSSELPNFFMVFL